MADTYLDRVPAKEDDPAIGAVVISYGGGDQTITGHARFLYITTAGNLKVDTARGDVGITLAFVTGLAPIKVTKIYQTGSTAAGSIWF